MNQLSKETVHQHLPPEPGLMHSHYHRYQRHLVHISVNNIGRHSMRKTRLANEFHLNYQDTQLLLPHTRFSLLIGHYEPLKCNLMQISKETNTKRRMKCQN